MRALFVALALACAACGGTPSNESVPTHASAEPAAVPPPPMLAPRSPVVSTVDRRRVPVPEDFDAEVRASLTADRFDAELARITHEIEADER
ncbi:MAG: hypothetical protein U0230_08955 [Polyangiales bacterium]